MRYYVRGSVDYSNLAGVIEENKKFLFSDIDAIFDGQGNLATIPGVAERKNHFLILETKIVSERDLADGQNWLLKAFRTLPRVTVLRLKLSGKKTAEGNWEFDPVAYFDERTQEWKKYSLTQFIDYYRNWYKWANRGGKRTWQDGQKALQMNQS